MFDEESRYKDLPYYYRTDRRQRRVAVVPIPELPESEVQGYHIMKQGQRLDHLAAKYLNNPTGFWRICTVNGVMLPETLSEQSEIAIPAKNR